MTQWRIIEGTNDEDHPDICDWTLLYYSEYDILLNPDFFKLNPYKRIKFSISNKMPTKDAFFQKVNREKDK